MMIPAVFVLSMMLGSSSDPVTPPVLARYTADGEHNWSSLILYTDNTFTYESRGGSCWAWQDWQGTWVKNADLLYLYYSIAIEESQERISRMANVSDLENVSVLVKTPEGTPIVDAFVTLNDRTGSSRTGSDGRAVIPYPDSSGHEGPPSHASRRVDMLTVGDSKHTTTFAISKQHSNYFEVVLDPDPPIRQEPRADIYRVKANRVHLIKDGVPERKKAFGETRPRILKIVDNESR